MNKILFTAFCLVISMGLCCQEMPNVVVILADDLGLGDISFYRKQHSDSIILETPTMDELAAQGVSFTNAHAPASLCAPSRYAIMTGNHCYRSKFPWGVWGSYEESPIGEEQLTLAKLMKNAGYKTAFFGKWHLGGDFLRKSNSKAIYRGPRNMPELDVDIRKIIGGGPSFQGFDYSLSFMAGIQDVPYAVYENSSFMPLEKNSKITYISQKKMDELAVKLDKSEGLGDSNWDPHDMGPLLIKKALAYIDSQSKADKPFFMYYSSLAVHLPHTPANHLNGQKIKGTTPSRHMDMIKELDVQLQLLSDKIKSKGLFENTLIILTSDNGGLLKKKTLNSGHRPSDIYRGGKNQAYEGGNRVPFIVLWPNKLKPRIETSPVLGLDIMGTLAGLTQQKLPKNEAMDAVNLMPLLRKENKELKNRTIITQAGTGKEAMIIKNGFKLIIQIDKSDKSNKTRLPIALFNLKENPSELESENLIEKAEFQDKVKELFEMYNVIRDDEKATR